MSTNDQDNGWKWLLGIIVGSLYILGVIIIPFLKSLDVAFEDFGEYVKGSPVLSIIGFLLIPIVGVLIYIEKEREKD